MVQKDDFFRETTLRICGSLQIAPALSDVFDYFKQHFPIIGISLHIRDDDLGAIRRVALAADNMQDFPEEIVPVPKDLWEQIQAIPVYGPQIISTDLEFPHSTMAVYFKLENMAELVLPLWMDNKLCGALSLRAAHRNLFQKVHLELLQTVSQPITIALANALAHERIQRFSELLAEDNRFLRKAFYPQGINEIIGQEEGMSNVMHLVKQVAPLNNTVLILGETGTGKELIANAIHFSSAYKDGPFVKVNCGAIPEHLIDSELFGHEKGAFTGAVNGNRGRFERAHKGTIFLDEIGELPLQAQIRLLRVLQTREIERVGGQGAIPIDIRVIAATHRNLENMVQENKFREDLWFRLNVFPLNIPPLRQRKKDIPALAVHFIKTKAKELGIKNVPAIAPGALRRLVQYSWPGNVRELENLVERELIIKREDLLTFHSLPTPAAGPADASSPLESNNDPAMLWPLDDAIAAHIMKALHTTGGKISGPGGAAELLQVNANTLRSRMRKLKLRYQRNN
ncbi:sigma 54-interacting transcriptional regulator [Desulfobulbus rhabdoformis]|uniref:sigma-54-dependent Fis family transcriptional regulator n=1 Tax=Desulfobulbus rhabdoformis TaxID=34032 RepID=UPI001966A5FD|nr:sigma 54-interacting transcriptional regulator [Desulfobulbus rhabdoformis]MBM9614569.1 sigma 54-interacting transcriptional regulator [Desulfobulbus rhabdoformis]